MSTLLSKIQRIKQSIPPWFVPTILGLMVGLILAIMHTGHQGTDYNKVDWYSIKGDEPILIDQSFNKCY